MMPSIISQWAIGAVGVILVVCAYMFNSAKSRHEKRLDAHDLELKEIREKYVEEKHVDNLFKHFESKIVSSISDLKDSLKDNVNVQFNSLSKDIERLDKQRSKSS